MSASNQDLATPLNTLLNTYGAKVTNAYRNRKIFTIFYNYSPIRQSLLKRGWLEKLSPNRFPELQSLPEYVILQNARAGNDYEAVAISKVINNLPAFFIWQEHDQIDLYADVHPYRNRIRRAPTTDFTTKVGLIGCAEQQQWFCQESVSCMLYPRFFYLGDNQEEHMPFKDEFRITQCQCLLRYLVLHLDKLEDIIDNENGTISGTIIRFALDQVSNQMNDLNSSEFLNDVQTLITEDEWSDFLINCNQLINQNHKIKCTDREVMEHVETCKTLLNSIEERRPDSRWDGCKNLWILKPGYQTRGLGITIKNNVDDILDWCLTHSNRRYIVQKYIEQPLLIYRTKFDIRQYMLMLIRESYVQIWLYKDCYLRFSSHEYRMDDLREHIHLTNNSIQRKYKNETTRDPRLPKSNMWSSDQFKQYLEMQNVPHDTWENRIFSGFRENVIAVVLASLDDTNLCENSFELFGCDFMLDEQYNPILIEINASPDLSASTDVTALICPRVLRHCIRVVVDLPRNSYASTGQFQMVYEVNYKFQQEINPTESLNVSGKSINIPNTEEEEVQQNEEIIE